MAPGSKICGPLFHHAIPPCRRHVPEVRPGSRDAAGFDSLFSLGTISKCFQWGISSVRHFPRPIPSVFTSTPGVSNFFPEPFFYGALYSLLCLSRSCPCPPSNPQGDRTLLSPKWGIDEWGTGDHVFRW